MKNLNLLLMFQVAGQNPEIKGATRIKVGEQGLMVYGQDGVAERIEIGQLLSFSIQPITATPLIFAA